MSLGPIALIGSGEYLPSMAELEGRLLEGRPKRFVQVPTAAALDGEHVLARWLQLGAEQAERLGVEQVAVVARDRTEADDPDLAAEVAGAGLIYLSGGNPAHLTATLRGTRLLRAIVAAWQDGAALAGCSAGAMSITSWAPSPRTFGLVGEAPGLGLVPEYRVIPHFDVYSAWVPRLVLRRVAAVDGVTTVGIDERTALVRGLDAGGWRVQGQQSVWRIDADGERTAFPSGSVLFA